MTERFRFFDSIDGEDEREYTADEFAEYFRQFIRNGIFSGGENLKVETDEQDMKTYIKPGYAWIKGYLYKIDTEPLVMEHKIADPSLNRIDRVVIRLDKTLENRYVKAFVLEGIPAENPQPPGLTRDNNIYEISLAQVEIIAGKSFIESYQITDERLNNDVCGIVTHLFEQVDTTDIFNKWTNYLNHKKDESDISYTDFMTELQSRLDTFQQTWDSWTEDKISEPGGEFYAQWQNWFNELQDTTNLVTKSQFDQHAERHTAGKADELNLENLPGESSELRLHKMQFESYLNDTARLIPSGLISMWSGPISNIPAGWALCDGTKGTPDLRDRFIMGATFNDDVGETGGENEVTLTVEQMPSHTHTGETDITGSHTHTINTYNGDSSGTAAPKSTSNAGSARSGRIGKSGDHIHSVILENTGGGQPHENRPAYYKLAFIMKL